MISKDGEWDHCDFPECPEKIKNNKWARIKADGWMFQRDGKAFCPKHIPAWYGKWKQKNTTR